MLAVRRDASRLAQIARLPRAPQHAAGGVGKHARTGVDHPQPIAGRCRGHSARRSIAAGQRPHADHLELTVVQERGSATAIDHVKPRVRDRLDFERQALNVPAAVVVRDRHAHVVEPACRIPVAAVDRAARPAAHAALGDGHQARGRGRTVAPVDRGRKRFDAPRRRVRKPRIGERADLQGHIQARVPHASRRHRQHRRRIGDLRRNLQRRRNCE